MALGYVRDGMTGVSDSPDGERPLDTEAVLWVAALDLVPIEERIQWVKTMMARIAQINAARAGVGEARSPFYECPECHALQPEPGKCWRCPCRRVGEAP